MLKFSYLSPAFLFLVPIGLMLFATADSIFASPVVSNSLYAGGTLSGDKSDYISPSLVSTSQGAFLKLVMQQDCNLVLYLGWGVLWSSGTSGRGSDCQAKMQSDGNFVVYTGQNQPVWASGTQGHPGAYVLIQNDGNVVVYLGNQALWSSGTDMSYSTLCQGTSLSGGTNPILSGSCKNFFGQMQQSSLPISGCGGIISDIDGVMRCVVSDNLGFDVVSVPSDVTNEDIETKVWRIDRPNVRVGDDPLPGITFRPGDTIRFNAGGCVQTGGLGQTWKAYVNPLGNNADHLYSGTIQISGVIGSPTRIAGVIQNSPWQVPLGLTPQTQAQLFLHLGYQDDDYGDNGYWNHDDGNPTQCAGTGPAWVEITVVSNVSGKPVSGPTFSAGSKDFDLVWDLKTGVDANGLPLDPIWFPQIKNPGTELDFQGTCGPAFPDGFTINDSVLANICTTDAPTADIDTGLSSLTLGIVCPANPIHGHLNWAIATHTGTLSWQGWSGDAGFWDDDDYNFGLSVPSNAGLCSGTPDEGPGLHLEFNGTEIEFQGPLWQSLFQDVQGSSSDPSALVDGKTAVVTGLFGIDGVHNGGYSESHPVYAMAVLTATNQSGDSLDQTWDFFIRNYGNEGMCSEQIHYWDGESGVYYIEFPWPMDQLGHRATDVSEGEAQAWFWSPSGVAITAPTPELDKDQDPKPTRSYLQVPLPSNSGLSGEVTLHYSISPGFRTSQPMGREVTVGSGRKVPAEAVALGHNDNFVDTGKLIADPVAKQRVDALSSPYRMVVKRNIVRVAMKPVMGVRKPPLGLASKGMLTHDRMAIDPIKAKWNTDLEQALGQMPHDQVQEAPRH